MLVWQLLLPSPPSDSFPHPNFLKGISADPTSHRPTPALKMQQIPTPQTTGLRTISAQCNSLSPPSSPFNRSSSKKKELLLLLPLHLGNRLLLSLPPLQEPPQKNKGRRVFHHRPHLIHKRTPPLPTLQKIRPNKVILAGIKHFFHFFNHYLGKGFVA